MSYKALPSFTQRLTVAKRKEAIELRKVSNVTAFCGVYRFYRCFTTKLSMFFSDNETPDGKEKARPH